MREKLLYVNKSLARRAIWAPSDLLRRRRRRERLLPPRGLSFVGDGDFVQVGQEFLGHFKELGGLRPDDRVLDIGCGVGRMAVPLVDYLDESGSYRGFDVGREMIAWCRRNISARRPDFEFAWAPVYNSKYNPFGTIAASEYRFPYEDSCFDFAFATSLFTHLRRDDAAHYLSEVARVLRPGGTCLLTFFLLTPDAERRLAEGSARLDFRHPVEDGLTVNRRRPEEAVALREDALRAMMAAAGLTVRDPVRAGVWSGREHGLTLQDIVVADAQ